jgi:hypothetical protein
MRKYITIYLFFTLFSLDILAEENRDIPIKTLIEKIKHAKVQDKRVLINQLKLRLRKMNENSRKKTITELKSSLNSKKSQRKRHRRGFKHHNSDINHRMMRHRHNRRGHK